MNTSNNNGQVSHMKLCTCTTPVKNSGDNYCKNCDGLIEDLIKFKGFNCNKYGGHSPTSNCCENPDCPNMPCCQKTKKECICFPENDVRILIDMINKHGDMLKYSSKFIEIEKRYKK